MEKLLLHFPYIAILFDRNWKVKINWYYPIVSAGGVVLPGDQYLLKASCKPSPTKMVAHSFCMTFPILSSFLKASVMKAAE